MLNTTVMYITTSRYENTKAQDVLVHVYRNNASTNPSPPYPVEKETLYTIPPYERLYEKLMSDNVWVGRNKWKNCQHYKKWVDPTRYDLFGIPWVCKYSSDKGWLNSRLEGYPLELATDVNSFLLAYGPYGKHIKGLPSLIQEDIGDGFVPRPTLLSELNNMAYKAMLSPLEIKSELSLVNSLIELKDFKSLPANLAKLRGICQTLVGVVKYRSKDLSTSLRRIRATFSRDTPTMREVLGGGSKAYLTHQFALKPLLSDISSFSRALSQTQRRINDLIVRRGKRQYKHFTKRVYLADSQYYASDKTQQVSLVDGQFAGAEYPPGFNGVYRKHFGAFKFLRAVQPEQVAEFHAQIEYNYNFTRFQIENAQTLGLQDALGLQLNPAIIWNALPWTFVLDWVINVSRWLDDRKVLNLEPKINITRYLWSYKTTRRTRLSLKGVPFFPPSAGHVMPEVHLPDLWETTYRRQVEMPEQTSLLATTGLSLKELSLGVALAITQRHRTHRRGR